jgi:uncharacterized metal-binding protein YceD (DUF177 family)
MDVLKTYKISFRGLQIGHHSFDFQINDQFFESFENSRIQQGKMNLNVVMEKSETMLQFVFKFDGVVQVECDRCLDSFPYPLNFEEHLIVKFGQGTHDESEDILVMDVKEYEIQLAQYIYEFISLSLPMQVIHPDLPNGDSGCNPDFLKNFEAIVPESEEPMDPRWEALKKLKQE